MITFATLVFGIFTAVSLIGLVRGTSPVGKARDVGIVGKTVLLALSLVIAWLSLRWHWLAGAMVSILAAVAGLSLLEEIMFRLDVREWERWIFAPLAAVALAGFGWALHRDIGEHLLAQKATAAQRILKKEFAQHKKKRRQLEPGVAEKSCGNMIAWLAVKPRIAIDWKYEQSLEKNKRAWRSIPLRVVVLNNSFEQDGVVTRQPQRPDLAWKVRIIQTESGKTIQTWTADEDTDLARLLPVEKVEFIIDWDGRDKEGALSPPGPYEVHFESAKVASAKRPVAIKVAFEVYDAGPVVIHQPDPVIEKTRNELRQQRVFNEMNRLSNLTRSMDFQIRSLQNLGR